MLPLSVSCALTLILVVLVLLALACLHARPITPTNTVRLTAPIAPEEGSALYDVESIPSGRWGGATGGQWLFQFDARRYTRERFDVFVLRRNGPGLHAPVAHFECTVESDPHARGEMHVALMDVPPFYRIVAGKEVAQVQSRVIPL